jgi:septal ring factor EnvC (AmiA/AmiB activator)
MKLAIEYLQQSIAKTESALAVSQDALDSLQAQRDSQEQDVQQKKAVLADMRAALVVLRSNAPAKMSLKKAS